MTNRKAIYLTLFYCIVHSVSAGPPLSISEIPCKLIGGLFITFTYIAPSLILLMFAFGAAKYAFSADDPGGRKQGKTIIIHAVIGAIIISLLVIVKNMFTSLSLCTQISLP